MRSKYKRVAMKKKIAPNKLVPFKKGNPPRQTKKAKLLLEPAEGKVLCEGKNKKV